MSFAGVIGCSATATTRTFAGPLGATAGRSERPRRRLEVLADLCAGLLIAVATTFDIDAGFLGRRVAAQP